MPQKDDFKRKREMLHATDIILIRTNCVFDRLVPPGSGPPVVEGGGGGGGLVLHVRARTCAPDWNLCHSSHKSQASASRESRAHTNPRG